MKEATKHSQAHATFAIERTYPVPVAAVWHALSDGAAREAWFTAGDAFAVDQEQHDFRVGGRAPRPASGTAARGRDSAPPTPTSSSRTGSSSPTTCGLTTSTCPRP